MLNNYHSCIHKRNIPGDAHIGCVKPDPNMKGNVHGIQNGWFFYPLNFDPVWMTKECGNFEGSVTLSNN